MSHTKHNRNAPARENGGRVLAVIEVGTTSIRMQVSQTRADGSLVYLDSLQQPVAIGRDSFTRGMIGSETIEACVDVLTGFREVLKEYAITLPHDVVAIATSAVREAANRNAFLDRLVMATGIDVKVMDETEVNRGTFLALAPYIRREPALRKGVTLAVEVGGGSTEMLVLDAGQVEGCQTHRLGSLRLRKMLEDERAPVARQKAILSAHIERSVQLIHTQLHKPGPLHMLAIGGEARWAAAELIPDLKMDRPACLPVKAVATLTDTILDMDIDTVVRRFHIPYPEAETLGPSLLILVQLARAFGVKQLRVGFRTLRDGILAEAAGGDPWSVEYRDQVLHSVSELRRKYGADKDHADRVADFASRLFKALQDKHGMPQRYELLLRVASLLHDIGGFVSNLSHHKHSAYLITHSDLFGLSPRDTAIVAQVARYHRRALPRESHPDFMALPRTDRLVVKKLAAMLRVADAVQRGRGKEPDSISIDLEPRELVITLRTAGDLTLEQHAMELKAPLIEEVFGMRVRLRKARRTGHHDTWSIDLS